MIEYETIDTKHPDRTLTVDTSGALTACFWARNGSDEILVMLDGDQAASLAVTLNRFAERVAAKADRRE